MSRLRSILTAARNRRELVAAGLTRRDLLRLGLITASGYLVARSGLGSRASGGQPASPFTRPFIEPLPIMPVLQQARALTPAPTRDPNAAGGEVRAAPHQAFALLPPRQLYEVHQREAPHRWHPDLPVDTVWGYEGIFPGPTYHGSYGQPVLVRVHNDLPRAPRDFGRNETSTHLHNAHTASESDGFPADFIGPGSFCDHHYGNVCAGFTGTFGPGGDVRETLGTLWYHDHRQDFTAQNTYKGLEGFYLLFGEHDSGDEEDPNPAAFRLPSGDFDVPLLFNDKVVDPETGLVAFDLFNLDGILGDKLAVNGKIQPYFEVHPRKYRFRCLDGGPSRFYQLFLTDLDRPERTIPFVQISSDGNLLPAPVAVTSISIAPAQRVDVIVDFSEFVGRRIVLENRCEQRDGRGPTGKVLPAGQGEHALRFDVVLPPVRDPSRVPERFFELPSLEPVTVRRTFRFERRNGQWAINGQFFDADVPIARVKQGSAEIWRLENGSGGWQHPIHIHLEECRILSIDGQPPPPTSGRRDTIVLGFNSTVEVFVRFRDFLGRHPFHCHNTVHEDHAMMARFDVDLEGDGGRAR